MRQNKNASAGSVEHIRVSITTCHHELEPLWNICEGREALAGPCKGHNVSFAPSPSLLKPVMASKAASTASLLTSSPLTPSTLNHPARAAGLALAIQPETTVYKGGLLPPVSALCPLGKVLCGAHDTTVNTAFPLLPAEAGGAAGSSAQPFSPDLDAFVAQLLAGNGAAAQGGGKGAGREASEATMLHRGNLEAFFGCTVSEGALAGTFITPSSTSFPLELSSHLVFAAFPDELVPQLTSALLKQGRAVVWKEPCVVWEKQLPELPDLSQRQLQDSTSGSTSGSDAFPEELAILLPYLSKPTSAEGAATSATPSAAADSTSPSSTTSRPPLYLPPEGVDWEGLSRALGLPPCLQVCQLQSHHAAIANKHWKYTRGEATERILRESIDNRPCCGILYFPPAEGSTAEVSSPASSSSATSAAAAVPASDSQSSPESQQPEPQLVSWGLLRMDLSIGVLNTVEEWRGKGLAPAVVKVLMMRILQLKQKVKQEAEEAAASSSAAAMATLQLRKQAAAALNPYCHIRIGNTASEKLFQRLGFKTGRATTWVLSTEAAPRFRLRPLNPANGKEWRDLLQLVNRSYKQDDAFFVDQTRTDLSVLQGMGQQGVFFLGYQLKAREGKGEAAAAATGAAGAAASASSDSTQQQLSAYLRSSSTGLSAVGFPVPMQSLQTCCPLSGWWRGEAAGAVATEAAAAGQSGAGAVAEAAAGRSSGSSPWSAFFSAAAEEEEGEALLAAVFLRATMEEEQKEKEDKEKEKEEAPSADSNDSTASVASSTTASSSVDVTTSSNTTGNTNTAFLSMLTIEPACKKKGLGQRVLDFACSTAVSCFSSSSIVGEVVSVKPWLLSFYCDRNGFRVEGQAPWPAEMDHQLILPTFFHKIRKQLV